MSLITGESVVSVSAPGFDHNDPTMTQESSEVIPSSPDQPVTISAPAAAQMVFVGTLPSAATVLLVGANEVVAQDLTSASVVPETVMLELKPESSPEYIPEGSCSPEPSTVGVLDAVEVGSHCVTKTM